MTRAALERHQVWIYLVAVGLGLVIGTIAFDARAVFETLVWPLLAALLYATFVQVPLAALTEAFRDGRFLVAALLGNFVIMPAVVWGLIQLLPADAPIRLGLLLVLLAPCSDWFIPFSQLGGGDAARASAITPLNLLIQLAAGVVSGAGTAVGGSPHCRTDIMCIIGNSLIGAAMR